MITPTRPDQTRQSSDIDNTQSWCGRYCLGPIWSCLTAIASIVKQILSSCCSYRVSDIPSAPDIVPNLSPSPQVRLSLLNAICLLNTICANAKLTEEQIAALIRKLQTRIEPHLDILKRLNNFSFFIVYYPDRRVSLRLRTSHQTTAGQFASLATQGYGTKHSNADFTFFTFNDAALNNIPIEEAN